jgi:hypothetical protein
MVMTAFTSYQVAKFLLDDANEIIIYQFLAREDVAENLTLNISEEQWEDFVRANQDQFADNVSDAVGAMFLTWLALPDED